ncbi:MAG: deoxyguanosinetriphosphate triphosphohydrolase [Rickettsiales bacterium]|nr:deoxyguanosinetriphosphate triphosphohydrolase [Rickettsiales bacterium]
MKEYSNFSIDYKKSKGRVFFEKNDIYRTCFMRDRDRIIHSSAFRRLKYKTQVFIYNKEDYFRTRLSHSIEVSQLARSIAKIFRVNDDLVESISLAHDLGHTPFGHAGEDELNYKMKKNGGFDHNFHALKILTKLEKKYPRFDGLNLTYETLDGILKHNGPIKFKVPNYISDFITFFNGDLTKNGSFESQLSSICDDIAYNNNDIDDGLHAGFFSIDELSEIELVKVVLKKIKKNNFNDSSRTRYELVRNLIKIMMDDLIQNTKDNLEKYKIKFSDDIRHQKVKIVSLSNDMIKEEKKMKLFLKDRMYLHPRIRTMTIKAKKIISDLFDLFIEEPTLMPDNWNTFENNKQKHINVCDYISGMTDNYAINIHRKFFDLYSF